MGPSTKLPYFQNNNFILQTQEAVARSLAATLPVATINVLTSIEWKGGDLLSVPESKGVRNPTAKEISANFWFIKPCVLYYPRKVGQVVCRRSCSKRIY